jgi:lipopolysaccharide/colanic/teichoic acid biosynthesis glycosyltransferase/glycosyltransferase involved in cell wall biosynthesis
VRPYLHMSASTPAESGSLSTLSYRDDRPTISIVVPAHNAGRALVGCIEALLLQVPGELYEIIVVDDGSDDDTWQIAQSYSRLHSQGCSPEVKAVRQPQGGAASARNLGVKVARGDIVLFTDADCEPVPSWALYLTRALRSGAAGAKGTYRTRQRSLTARFVQAEYESKYRRMRRLSRIDFIDTYSAAYRRDLFLEAGGFDEEMLALEDQELSFRLAERGYRLVFVPEAVVYHIHASTPTAYLRKKFWIGYWKVRVSALHPGRIVNDSHTPVSIKAQMILFVSGFVSLLEAPFSQTARRSVLACAAAFLSTAVPLAARLGARDSRLAIAAPAMMMLRAMGLSAGFLTGIGRFGHDLARAAGYTAVKRLLDLVGSALGLVVTAPLMVLIALVIKLSSKGPALFVQWRAGVDGKPFRMYKFRTMVEDAEAMRDALARERGLEEPVLKFYHDPRVTRVGRFLRRWSLDELPQLVNVLRGEMSLVGPRPEELRIVARYSHWHRERLKAKPGITGPMQISGRAGLVLDERVRVELEYIEHVSVREDLRILARTIPAIISGDGSY